MQRRGSGRLEEALRGSRRLWEVKSCSLHCKNVAVCKKNEKVVTVLSIFKGVLQQVDVSLDVFVKSNNFT